MPRSKNSREYYDARLRGPAGQQSGELVTGHRRPPAGHPGDAEKMRWFRSW
ncbi:MAG: hypothetical protein V3T05_08460 [Myxococcota bacterium]